MNTEDFAGGKRKLRMTKRKKISNKKNKSYRKHN